MDFDFLFFGYEFGCIMSWPLSLLLIVLFNLGFVNLKSIMSLISLAISLRWKWLWNCVTRLFFKGLLSEYSYVTHRKCLVIILCFLRVFLWHRSLDIVCLLTNLLIVCVICVVCIRILCVFIRFDIILHWWYTITFHIFLSRFRDKITDQR